MRTSPDFIFKFLLLSLESYSATSPGVGESYETFPKGVWSCRGRTRAARQSLLQWHLWLPHRTVAKSPETSLDTYRMCLSSMAGMCRIPWHSLSGCLYSDIFLLVRWGWGHGNLDYKGPTFTQGHIRKYQGCVLILSLRGYKST